MNSSTVSCLRASATLGLALASQAAAQSALRFADVTADCGIDMIMVCGKQPSTEILEVNGGGLGLIDFDQDHDLDLFVANGATMDDTERGPGSRLYENLGGMKFRDVTGAAGITLTRWAMGVAVGDFDADGRDDLYVACFGPDVLLRNTGTAGAPRFEDVTAAAGLGDPRWGSSAAFGDIDNDGDLDLYVANYLQFDVTNPPPRSQFKGVDVMAGPRGLDAQHDVLYENLGDGTFRDITESSGCLPPHAAYGLNVIIADLDGNGWQDIFVANDSMANFHFRNKGEGKFEEVGMLSSLATNADGAEQASMGIALGDVNADGCPDLFTSVFSSDTNTLHVSASGGKFFDDRTAQYRLGMISRPYLGWACGFYDFEHDGDEDLLLLNGHVYPEATPERMDSSYEQTPLLFERTAQHFERVSDPAAGEFIVTPRRDRCAAFGDLDADGDIDVVSGELNGPVRVIRNDSAKSGAWLIVELRDSRQGIGNHRALGSRIQLAAGDTTQTRWLFSGGGFQSSSAPMAHFGIADPDAALTLTVTWPDGRTQKIESVKGNERLLVTRQ
jgi:hypothetical protein